MQAGGLSGYPLPQLEGAMETWEPVALRGSGKTNFLWQREWCRAVDTADYFSCSLMGGGREKSKKEREIKSTRVKLAQRAGFKTRDETTTPVLAARRPLSSQPQAHRARRPHRREFDPMFHKALYLRGKGRWFLSVYTAESELKENKGGRDCENNYAL